MCHILPVPSVSLSLFLFSFGCSLTVPVRVTLPVGYRSLSAATQLRFIVSFFFSAPMFRPAAPAMRDTIYTFSFPTNWAAMREQRGIGLLLQVDRKKNPGPRGAQRRPFCQVSYAVLLPLVRPPPFTQSVAWQRSSCRPLLVEDMQLGTTNRRRLCGTPLFSPINKY